MSVDTIPYGVEQDKGYRRGFDQGIYVALKMLGLDDDTLQDLVWKKKIVKWRYSSLSKTCDNNCPPWPVEQEKTEAQAAVLRALV